MSQDKDRFTKAPRASVRRTATKMVKKSLVSEGSLVDVRSDEEGFRDVYFLATVTTPPANFSKGRNAKSKTKDRVYVEYCTLLEDEEGSGFLREFVDLKFLRPAPAPSEIVEGFEVDDVVDAYYSEGWWIGVVKKVEEGPKYVVSFQDPPDELTFGMSELRVHWDWVDGHWIRPVQQKAALMFDVGRNVEVSIGEENCLNAWFPATIHEIVKDGYFAVELCQKVGNEAQSSRVTVDRLHVRPIPPHLDPKYIIYALSDKVDAFIDGGWWSGVIIKELEDGRYAVFFKETEKTEEFHRSEIRHHMEWDGTKWITSFQDVLMPSSDSEKQGGHICPNSTEVAAPVGSSDEGKTSTKERIPCLRLTPCNNERSHVITSSTKKRCNLPSDSFDDLSMPLKKLKLGTPEASGSLAPERKTTLVTSSNAMVCGSTSPTSGSTRISSDKRNALGDLSSNSSCRGQRIGRKNVEQDSSTSGSMKKGGGRERQIIEQDTSASIKRRGGRGRKNVEQDSPTSTSLKKRGRIPAPQVKNPKSVGGLASGKETSSDHGDHLSVKEVLKPASEMDQQSYDSAMQRIKDIPATGSTKERRTLKLRVKRSEFVVGDLATVKASSNDTRDTLLTDKEPSMPVSEQEKQSMVQSKKDNPTSDSMKKERTQDLRFQSSVSVVGGITTRKMRSGNKSDLLSIDTESLKCVNEQEQYNDSASERIKDFSTSVSMNKGGTTEELQAKSPESVVGGFCQMLIASSFAAGKTSLSQNRDLQSIDMEPLRPDSEQDLQLNDPVMQRIKESDQAETGEGTRKRKRGRPRKISIESHQNQVTDTVQSGDVAADEMVRKDSKANEVGSHTSVEVIVIGKGGILNNQESTTHDKNSGHPKQNNLSGSMAEKTHTKMSDAKDSERSTNPNENHSSMEGRRATDGNSASQVQDSVDAPGSKTPESNRIVNESKKVITVLPSTEFDDEPLSKWIEEMQTLNAVDGSRASGDQCVEETTRTQKEIALLTDCTERQKESGIATNILGDKGSIVLSEPQSLPFVKNTILWSTIESMDVFQMIPQKPHFQPLQLVKESSREGIAIGLMVTFSSVVEKALHLKLDDPKSILDDILENLEDLERHGFEVQAVRDRVCAILPVKDRKEELITQAEQVSSEIAQQNLEINHMDEEINEIEEQMRKLQEKLLLAESAKAKKDCLISSLKSKIREIEESIEAVVRDFEGLAAGPL